MKKRIIACILAIGLALTAAVTYRLSVGLPAMAASSIDEAKAQLSILQSQYEILKKNSQNATEEYEDAKKKYEEAKDNVENAKALKESVDAQIYTLQQEIDAAFQLLEIYESEVTRLEEDIAEKEKQIEEHQGLFVQRLRLNYEDSFTSYLEIVLSSENFSDFLYRLDVVASLLDYDKRVLKELSDAKTALEQMKEEKIALQTGQQKTYESLLEKQPLLESKLEECENALLAYQEAQRLALTAKDETEEAKKAAEAAQAAAQKQIDDAEEELRQKIIAEQERLRLEAEERARKAAEEARKRLEEERKRQEAQSGSSSSGEPASDSGSTTQIPYTPGSIYGIPGGRFLRRRNHDVADPDFLFEDFLLFLLQNQSRHRRRGVTQRNRYSLSVRNADLCGQYRYGSDRFPPLQLRILHRHRSRRRNLHSVRA